MLGSYDKLSSHAQVLPVTRRWPASWLVRVSGSAHLVDAAEHGQGRRVGQVPQRSRERRETAGSWSGAGRLGLIARAVSALDDAELRGLSLVRTPRPPDRGFRPARTCARPPPPCRPAAAASSTRLARVSSRFACAIRARNARRAEGGSASHLSRAGGERSRAAARSVGPLDRGET